MIRILTLLFASFICLNTQGQKLNPNIFQLVSKESTLDKRLGNAYFNESFIEGQINFTKKDNSQNYPLRYNAYLDRFEVKFEGALYTLTKTSGIDIKVEKDTYIFRAYYNSYTKKIKTGYLKKLNNSPFFIRHTKKIREGRKPANSVAATIPDKLVESKKLYALDEEGTVREIKWNTKTILMYYPQKELDELKEYIKQNRLKIKKESDFYQLYEYHKEMLKKSDQLAK